jgi:hypothetical protein
MTKSHLLKKLSVGVAAALTMALFAYGSGGNNWHECGVSGGKSEEDAQTCEWFLDASGKPVNVGVEGQEKYSSTVTVGCEGGKAFDAANTVPANQQGYTDNSTPCGKAHFNNAPQTVCIVAWVKIRPCGTDTAVASKPSE